MMTRGPASTLLGAAAVMSGLCTGILLLIVGVFPLSAQHGVNVFPLAAAVVQLLSSCTLGVLILIHIRHPDTLTLQKGIMLMVSLGLLPSVVSAAVDGASLGWAEASDGRDNVLVLGTRISTFLTITFAVWGAAVLAQLVYYFNLAWILRPGTDPLRTSLEDCTDGTQNVLGTSRPPTVTTAQTNPFQECSSPSAPSLIFSDGTSSMRTSISTIQGPPSSRRGLLIRHSKQRTKSPSLDGPSRRTSQDEGFDSWDTSSVSLQIRETVLQPKVSMKGPGLEPIPGSRSPSPAKALEGPFFQSSPASSPPASPLPQPSVSQPNSAPASPADRPFELPNFSTMFPPPSPPPTGPPPAIPRHQNFSRPGSRSGPISRSGSVAIPRSRQGSRSGAPTEDHIHPLFRTNSPTPPPSASANTVVTAAPEGGQLINERMLKRMRSGSLPSSPSPLVRSESSPNIGAVKVPPSPSLDTMPIPHTVEPRPDRSHQRKRSASFQSTIDV